MKRCNKKKCNGISPVKTAVAIAGIAATSIFLYEKFNKMHDKKIRQCFERFECDFDDDETLYECDDLDDNFGTIVVDSTKDNSSCCGNNCGSSHEDDSSPKNEEISFLDDDENNA